MALTSPSTRAMAARDFESDCPKARRGEMDKMKGVNEV